MYFVDELALLSVFYGEANIFVHEVLEMYFLSVCQLLYFFLSAFGVLRLKLALGRLIFLVLAGLFGFDELLMGGLFRERLGSKGSGASVFRQ